MSCTERYAEAWQYASFWCKAQLLTGEHEGAGPADVALSVSVVNFPTAGALANVGQIMYNVTQGTSGFITGVTQNTITATGVTWNLGDTFRSAFLDAADRSRIEHYLDLTAGPIHAALAAVNACDCTLSSWGAAFLADQNVISARIFYDCPCSTNLTDREKILYADMVKENLKLLRSGEIDVCEGETGSLYPVLDFAQRGWDEFSQAGIIEKDMEKNLAE